MNGGPSPFLVDGANELDLASLEVAMADMIRGPLLFLKMVGESTRLPCSKSFIS